MNGELVFAGISLVATAIIFFAIGLPIINKTKFRYPIDKPLSWILIPLFIFIAVHTTICAINYITDTTEPAIVEMTITNKDYTRKLGWHFSLSDQKEQIKIKCICVTSDLYYEKEIGDTIFVRLHKGGLGQEYYLVKYEEN